MSLLLLGLRRGPSSLRSPSQLNSPPCIPPSSVDLHAKVARVRNRDRSCVSPSLRVGPILTVQHYPSSSIFGKHGAEPKLGSNCSLAATRRGRPVHRYARCGWFSDLRSITHDRRSVTGDSIPVRISHR